MKEQKLVLNNLDSFELEHIFDCGQCFRWNKQDDDSYIGVINSGVLKVSKNKNRVVFEGILEGDINSIIYDYFDLGTNYDEIKREFSKIDDSMKKSVDFGYGIRILNQDLWETIISFEISANNNIPRIKGIIDRICKKYGNEIKWNEKKYYTFPSIQELSKASIKDLRDLGLGFRDKRIYDTTQIFLNGEMTLSELENEKDTEKVKDKLLTLPGVGPKVADCILLFSLKRYEVFPIDVWVRRVMNELYIHEEDEEKVSKKDLQKLAKDKYSNLAGLAQQYLFYWKREA